MVYATGNDKSESEKGFMKENLITIKTGQKGNPIGDLFGIFLEDLNHAADGGLYAEMVQNRSFEFSGKGMR